MSSPIIKLTYSIAIAQTEEKRKEFPKRKGLPANNRFVQFKMSRLYEEYNKNQLVLTMSQIALFLVNTGLSNSVTFLNHF